MNISRDIIQRCHQRHKQPLQQKKTVVTPSAYKGLHHHFTVYCAHRYPVTLFDLEDASISFMPVGGGPESDRVPHDFGGERFLKRQKLTDWETRQWHTSYGIRVYTGIPSQRQGAPWHDLEFGYAAISAAPEAILDCIETLVTVVENPLLTLTKTGGLRFSCRVEDYLHPDTQDARLYIYKDRPTPENPYLRDVYLQILAETGHSAWDARCEILSGDLLNPPVIAKGILFAVLDTLRLKLHAPDPDMPTHTPLPLSETDISVLPFLDSYKLNLAKEALFKRGFVYIGEAQNFHHWTAHRNAPFTTDTTDVVLWQTDDGVWIRASRPDLQLPTENTRITDVFDNTGILPPVPAELRVSDEMLAVRQEKLTPLAIKRPAPVLPNPETPEKVYQPFENNHAQLQKVFQTHKRIVGLIAETDIKGNYEVESYLLRSGSVALSARFPILDATAKHFQSQNIPSHARWRHVGFLHDKIKDISVDIRMQAPFEHGNVCEDPERFQALIDKGVDAKQTLCPQCPVYTACQERGYLSQPHRFANAEISMFGSHHTFLDPQELALSEEIPEFRDETQRLCIISFRKTDDLFLGANISQKTLEQWSRNWQGQVLGDFAAALLNTLKTKNTPDHSLVRCIRIIVAAFELHEAEIVRQMSQVNVRGKVVERIVVDDETGAALARFGIEFQGEGFAYIPLNPTAADKLIAKGLQVFRLESFRVNEETRIPMSIQRAIGLGIFDITTVESIQGLPNVYRNPDWTLWHQLKRFLNHYTRDADAPMIYYDEDLRFWLPPVLHPSIKKLLLVASNISQQELHKAFASEAIEFIKTHATPWGAGNQVFQIRSGAHTLKALLDYDRTWDVIGFSDTGERLFLGICADIDRDPSVKHAVITHFAITQQLSDLVEKENVVLLTEFHDLENSQTALEAADVIWIVGTPFWEPGDMWRRAQVLFGNDTEPLSYEADTALQHYKDRRVQRIYTQAVAELITDIFGRAGLNRLSGKKVVLISSLEIPNVTDRPETLFFDWEDFEVAGGLEKLSETLVRRQAFEAKRDQITAEDSRQYVEQILGCSPRQANRVLQKLRGGNLPRVTFREQILALLADGEKKAADVVDAIDGSPPAIYYELRRLTEMGVIQKVGCGLYALPETD